MLFFILLESLLPFFGHAFFPFENIGLRRWMPQKCFLQVIKCFLGFFLSFMALGSHFFLAAFLFFGLCSLNSFCVFAFVLCFPLRYRNGFSKPKMQDYEVWILLPANRLKRFRSDSFAVKLLGKKISRCVFFLFSLFSYSILILP